MSDFTNFRAVYDDLTDEVGRAKNQFLPEHLKSWFDHLEQTPLATKAVQDLHQGLDFNAWYKEAESSRKMRWPDVRKAPLGMKLLLFEQVAAEKLNAGLIGYAFMNAGRNVNDNAHAFIEQVFMPMARDLRRYLESQFQKPEAVAPASDRVVSLDHNQPEYQHAVASLDKLIKTIKETNDYADVEEKGQRLAEVSAARGKIFG